MVSIVNGGAAADLAFIRDLTDPSPRTAVAPAHLRSRTLACLCAVAILGAGCAPARSGRRSQRALRIVSAAPSTTETLFALGVGDRVVGVSRYCDHPPAVRSLPRVGGFLDPNYEAILSLSPDLVVGARSPTNRAVIERIQATGVRCVFPPVDTVPEIAAMFEALGAATGRRAEAQRLVVGLHDSLADLRRRLAPFAPKRTLLVYDLRALSVAGPGSFGDAVLGLAGATNAVTTGPHYPMLSIEAIVLLAPEVIVIADMGARDADAFDRFARYGSIPAVRDRRVVRVETETLLRPGPRFGEGVAALAHAIHPGLQ